MYLTSLLPASETLAAGWWDWRGPGGGEVKGFSPHGFEPWYCSSVASGE